MLKKGLFKKPKNDLEGSLKSYNRKKPEVPDEMCTICPSCKKTHFTADLSEKMNVCGFCGHHFRINARLRIFYTADENSFQEHDANLVSKNIIDFPGYNNKLKAAKAATSENEAVVTGVCKVGGYKTAIFAMEPFFMMGSMGSVVGEKITRLFEYAAENNLPVIGYTVSGGARMQEGIVSLMQMAKVSGAVGRHSGKGLLYVTVLTDPTTGGVTASFAMEGDIIISEPRALIGFAGARVIEQTIRQKLPAGFQRAEFLLEKGFIDNIVERKAIRGFLRKVLSMHALEGQNNGCL